jgi:hypothetical protein
LTYKGDSTFKTTIGAAVSLVIMTILVAYAVYLAISMFAKTQSSVQNTSLILDLNSIDPFSPSEVGFDLAFGVGAPLKSSYGYYSVNWVHYYYVVNATGSKIRMKDKIPIDIETCGVTGF